jgi:pimeloyl-ACP methyl ester carboxylesterase
MSEDDGRGGADGRGGGAAYEPGGHREHGAEEAVTGRYVWVHVDDRPYRVYYERAGEGDVPLLCLHTAGGDARQWRHVLADPAVRERYTVYAFDLPWHGRSFPPMDGATDWRDDEYRLTTDEYAGHVVAFADAVGVEDPVVLGCSMGGAIVLELAAEHAETCRAVVGVESTAFAPKRDLGYLGDPTIDTEVVRGEWADGLQAPTSPDRFTRETWWTYASSGPGVYTGDLHFYATDWDGRDTVEDIDTDACPVYLLTGEYDYSALPEDTEAVAEAVDGATVDIMDDIGHFPMVENPPAFREHLLPVLEDAATE